MAHLHIHTPDIAELGEAPKLITCVIPDEGNKDLELLRSLRSGGDIITATSYQSRWVGSLSGGLMGDGKQRKGRRAPQAKAVRVISVVVAGEFANDVFQSLYDQAEIDRPEGGIMYMGPLGIATLFTLPEGVTDEPG
ncbi:MAG: hypothetical protein HQL53_06160 [Magnetococcales bacterium]|nr:hypothetical protein [Magnetococcales bacterium]